MSFPSVDYTTTYWREGDSIIAHAMPLDIMSSGDSKDAASLALDEAIRLFLATAFDQGVLDDVLEEAGYSLDDDGWHAPCHIATEHRAIAGCA